MAHDALRMHDRAIDEVVGDIEQAVDELAVARNAFGQHGIALTARGRTLDDEPALRTNRHDDRVLDHLRLDQAKYFGTEILAPVRPAQAATRDRAKAQMHAFDARRIDEDLAIRSRLRQLGQLRRVELEARVVMRVAVMQLVVVGAQRGADHRHEAAQDAVFVDARNAFEQEPDRRHDLFDLAFTIEAAAGDEFVDQVWIGRQRHLGYQRRKFLAEARTRRIDRGSTGIEPLRIELRFEQLDQQARDIRVAA